MHSCGSDATQEHMANIDGGLEEDVIFKADEDSGDDGYIISDENEDRDSLEDEYKEENAKENPSADVEDDDFEFVAEEYASVDNKDDFIEKSAKRKTISREAISETTYSSSENADFLVIAGSFSNEVNADKMVEKLKDMGYDDAQKIVFDFSQYYSVVSAKHNLESSARAMSLELKNKNINAYVHKMRSKFFGD